MAEDDANASETTRPSGWRRSLTAGSGPEGPFFRIATLGSESTASSRRSSGQSAQSPSGLPVARRTCDSEDEDAVGPAFSHVSSFLQRCRSEVSVFSVVPKDSDESSLDAYRDLAFTDQGEGAEDDSTVVDTDHLGQALAYIRRQRALLKTRNPEVIEEESRFKAWIEADEMLLLHAEERQQKSIRSWVRFDMIFGFFVLANGIVMGLTTQRVLEEESTLVTVLEVCFLVIFVIEWLIRWYFKPTGLRGMFADKWSAFDFIIIVVAFVDTVIIGALDHVSGASLITVLRVVRLLRLVRLVRLFKLLKELWMLVSGMMASVRILLWSLFMLSVICYMFGLFLLEFMRDPSKPANEPDDFHWGSVPQAMLSMAEIATHNGVPLMRQLSEELGAWILFVVFGFLFLASLGLLNLIVGVLLTSALQLAQRDSRYEDSITRLLQHRALRFLRELLIERCHATLGESGGSPQLTRGMLLRWVADRTPAVAGDGDREPEWPAIPADATEEEAGSLSASLQFKGQLMKGPDSKVTPRSFRRLFAKGQATPWSFASGFEEAGVSEDEINVIFNEIDSVNFGESSISVDEFIEGCILMKTMVTELDVVKLLSGIRALHQRFSKLQSAMATTSQALREACAQTSALLEKYYVQPGTKEEAQEEAAGREAGEDEEARRAYRLQSDEKQLFLMRQEVLLAQANWTRLQERRNWDKFDVVFSTIVFANAVVLGLEVILDVEKIRDIRNPSFNRSSMLWFTLDQLFFVISIFEFALRIIFHYQMTVQHDFRVWLFCFPKLMWMMDRQTLINVLLSATRWLKDFHNLLILDFTIVLVTAVDNVILRWVKAGGSYTRALRLLGLLRLLRLMRLMHLVRPLTTLVLGFIGNVKLIFWSLAMLLGLIYAGAITTVELLGKDAEDETVHRHWGHISSAMLTLGQMVTYTRWTERVDELSEVAPWNVIFSLVFVGLTSLGILNLVTGVMVQAAFHIMVGEQDLKLNHKLNMTRVALREAAERAFSQATEQIEVAQIKLRTHIRLMRQASIDENSAAHEKEREALGLSVAAGRPLLWRSSAQSLGDGEQIRRLGWLFEQANEESELLAAKWPKSSYSTKIFCRVTHSTWLSPSEVAVGIATADDVSTRGPQRDPMLSALIWENGRTSPVLFMPDDPKCDDIHESTPLKGRSTWSQRTAGTTVGQDQGAAAVSQLSAAKGQLGALRHRTGDLLFRGVPTGRQLHFRFGGNYGVVPLFPSRPSDAGLECCEVTLADVEPVDIEVVGMRELNFLVQDPVLIRRLQEVNMRVEQVLIVFQILNANGTGKVKTADFIEGLLRIRRQDVGLDTAGAKSLLRRLLMQVKTLSKQTAACDTCFSGMVQKLRSVEVLDATDEACHEARDDDVVAEMRERELVLENEKLRIKCNRLRSHIAERKAALHIHGDLGVHRQKQAKEAAEDDELSQGMSITSASPGWD